MMDKLYHVYKDFYLNKAHALYRPWKLYQQQNIFFFFFIICETPFVLSRRCLVLGYNHEWNLKSNRINIIKYGKKVQTVKI